jgi:hypothetical protein
MKFVLAAIALMLASASTFSQQQRATDTRLVDAGFKMRAAVTKEQIEHVKKLPPRRFIPREDAGRRYYVYADPDDCQCVFVGDELALKAYRDMVSAPRQPAAASRGEPYMDVIIHDRPVDLPQLDMFNHPF